MTLPIQRLNERSFTLEDIFRYYGEKIVLSSCLYVEYHFIHNKGIQAFSYEPFSNKILSQKYLKYISYQIETEHMCEVNIDNGLKLLNI